MFHVNHLWFTIEKTKAFPPASLLLSASFPLASHRSWPSSRQSLDVISEDPELHKRVPTRRRAFPGCPNFMEYWCGETMIFLALPISFLVAYESIWIGIRIEWLSSYVVQPHKVEGKSCMKRPEAQQGNGKWVYRYTLQDYGHLFETGSLSEANWSQWGCLV